MIRALSLAGLALALAACTQPADPVALAEGDRLACNEAGFDAESDAYRLCLLLQQTNRRLDMVDRRLDFLEVTPFGSFRGRCVRGYDFCR